MRFLISMFLFLFSHLAFSDASIDYTSAVDLDSAPKQVGVAFTRVLIDADSATLAAAADLTTDAYIPQGAIVTKAFYKIINKFESVNGNTLQMGCNSSSDDLVTAQPIYGYASGDMIVVKSFGSSADLVKIGSGGCEIIGVVGSGASGITAGRGVFFFEYAVGELSAGD